MELSLERFLDIPGIKDVLFNPSIIENVGRYSDRLFFTIGETLDTKTWSQFVNIFDDFVIVETKQSSTTGSSYSMMLVDYNGNKLINVSGHDLALAKKDEEPFVVLKNTGMFKPKVVVNEGMFGMNTISVTFDEELIPEYKPQTYYIVQNQVRLHYRDRWDFMCALFEAEDSDGNKIVRYFY